MPLTHNQFKNGAVQLKQIFWKRLGTRVNNQKINHIYVKNMRKYDYLFKISSAGGALY